MSQSEIKAFWDKQADEHGEASAATVPDQYAKDLEVEAICQYLRDGDTVADIGCGNGYSCFKYLEQKDIDVTGIDYSEKMIEQAQRTREKLSAKQRDKVRFAVASVLATELPDSHFDQLITDRCIINLTSRDEQAAVFSEAARILKPGGYYLMCENSEQALANLNGVRALAGLESIAVRWHNLYLDEDHMRAAWQPHFELVKEHRFGGFYYLASRVINALIAEESGEAPSYDSPINRAAAKVSAKFECGDFGPVKLFVLKKK